MKTLPKTVAAILLGTATIAAPAIGPVMAHAQDAVGGTNSIHDKRGYDALDDAQKAEYDAWAPEYQTVYLGWPVEYQTVYWGWPVDYRTVYWTWPADYQTYYWSLTPDQQTAYWMLTADQRAQIAAMTPEQQAAAWDAITTQLAASSSKTVAANASAAGQANANVKFVSNPRTEAAPPPPKEYPICSATITDGCIQPRAAGKNYGNRPLDYWPGKPASQM